MMRRPHAEKQTEIDKAYARYFCDKINALCDDYPPELVFNLDKTCWRLFEAPRKKREGDSEIEIASERETVIYHFWRDNLQWK
jgi:hypothetical protein